MGSSGLCSLESGFGGKQDSGILLMRCAGCARAAGALGTRRRQAARGGAVPGLGAALQSGKRSGSRQGGAGSSGEQRGASRCVGLPGRVGPGRGALAEPERTARRGGRAGRHGYWPSSGRRVVLRGVLRPLAPACLIFSKQNYFADLGACLSWMFQVTHPIPELRDLLASCLFVVLYQNLE